MSLSGSIGVCVRPVPHVSDLARKRWFDCLSFSLSGSRALAQKTKCFNQTIDKKRSVCPFQTPHASQPTESTLCKCKMPQVFICATVSVSVYKHPIREG